MSLLEVAVADGVDRVEALRLVGALEAASEHPIARAIAAGATAEVGPLPAVEGFANRAGLGVEGVVEGRAVVAGRPAHLADWGLRLPADLEERRADAPRPPDAPSSRPAGTVRPVRCSWSPTRSSRPAPKRSPASGHSACGRSS